MPCVWTQPEFGNIITTCSTDHAAAAQAIPWWAYGMLGLAVAAIVMPIIIWRMRRSE